MGKNAIDSSVVVKNIESKLKELKLSKAEFYAALVEMGIPRIHPWGVSMSHHPVRRGGRRRHPGPLRGRADRAG